MAEEDVDELFKGFYETELDRLDKQDATTSRPATVITVLFGVGAFYVQHLPVTFDGLAEPAFWFLSVVFGLALFASSVCLFVALFGPVSLVASPVDLYEFFVLRKDYYAENHSSRTATEMAEDDLKALLRSQFIECASANRTTNIEQSRWLFWCKRSIGVAVFALFMSAAPFYFIQHKAAKAQAIQAAQNSSESEGKSQNAKPPKANTKSKLGPAAATSAPTTSSSATATPTAH